MAAMESNVGTTVSARGRNPLAFLDAEIEELKASRSWKITKPLRKFTDFILRRKPVEE